MTSLYLIYLRVRLRIESLVHLLEGQHGARLFLLLLLLGLLLAVLVLDVVRLELSLTFLLSRIFPFTSRLVSLSFRLVFTLDRLLELLSPICLRVRVRAQYLAQPPLAPVVVLARQQTLVPFPVLDLGLDRVCLLYTSPSPRD